MICIQCMYENEVSKTCMLSKYIWKFKTLEWEPQTSAEMNTDQSYGYTRHRDYAYNHFTNAKADNGQLYI